MKKIVYLTMMFCTAFVLASCKASLSGPDGEVPTLSGVPPYSNLVIDGKTYDKTGEVYAATDPSGTTVQ